MSKVALNKSSLAEQRSQLRLFQKFLPSLDLKRQQLLMEQKKARSDLAETVGEMSDLDTSIQALLKPLGAYHIDLAGLVRVESLDIGEQNIVGARLPVVHEVKMQRADYAMLAKPFWVDFLVEHVERMCILRIHRQVKTERLKRLDLQVRKITQRVNLFEKVLIPRAKENIKRIRIGLGEQERSAVVRSKIAKKKHSTWEE
jgi:V/A-type H+-transporting ATPase subunit D